MKTEQERLKTDRKDTWFHKKWIELKKWVFLCSLNIMLSLSIWNMHVCFVVYPYSCPHLALFFGKIRSNVSWTFLGELSIQMMFLCSHIFCRCGFLLYSAANSCLLVFLVVSPPLFPCHALFLSTHVFHQPQLCDGRQCSWDDHFSPVRNRDKGRLHLFCILMHTPMFPQLTRLQRMATSCGLAQLHFFICDGGDIDSCCIQRGWLYSLMLHAMIW